MASDLIARLLGILGKGVDGQAPIYNRVGAYGEGYGLSAMPWRHVAADEGTYQVYTNPTIGTALGFGVNATFDETKSALYVGNINPVGGKSIILDYFKLNVTVAPASATNLLYHVQLDNAARIPSGGNAQLACQNPNSGASNASGALVHCFTGGAVMTVAASSSNMRKAARGMLRGVIPVVNDELMIRFGMGEPFVGPTATATGQVSMAPPIVIAPGWAAHLYLWGLSNAATGLSAHVELGLYER